MLLKKSFLKINLIAVLCVLLSLSYENLYAQTNTQKHILVFGEMQVFQVRPQQAGSPDLN